MEQKEKEDKKKWLNRYREASLKIEVLEEQIIRLQALAEKINATYSSDVQTTQNSENNTEKSLASLIDIKLQLENEREKILKIYQEINSAIQNINSPELQVILTRKYLLFQKNYQIAESMYLDRRTIDRKLEQAVGLVKLPLNAPK